MISFRCQLDRGISYTHICGQMFLKNKAYCSPYCCWALSNQFMALIDWKSRPFFTWTRENSSYSKDCLVRWGNFSGTLTEIDTLQRYRYTPSPNPHNILPLSRPFLPEFPTPPQIIPLGHISNSNHNKWFGLLQAFYFLSVFVCFVLYVLL